jgi:hypothetical protein
LCEKLYDIFKPIIGKSPLYVDLGSSQACELANRAVSLKAPKHIHYGESESLDFRVKVAAASINEGRKYLSEVAADDVRKLLFGSARCFLVSIFSLSSLLSNLITLLSGFGSIIILSLGYKF